MKTVFSKTEKALFVPVIIFSCFFALTSCQKEIIDFSVKPAIIDTTPKAAIIIQNNTPGLIHLTVNGKGIEKHLRSNGSDTLYGTPLMEATVIVETLTVDINDNPAGEQLVFQYAVNFPEVNKSMIQEVNVPSTFFFVNVINLSAAPANQVSVSEPGVDRVINSDIIISNTRKEIACGYYPTHHQLAEIKVVKNTEGIFEWNFTNIQLPGKPNQSITVTCN